MNYAYFDGEFYPSDGPVLPVSNRAFHFADGFFETIRVVNGKPVFLDAHFSRILDTMKAYRMERSIQFTRQKLEKELLTLLEKNEIRQGGRVRITFSRKSPGFYSPAENETSYVIEAYPLEHNGWVLNQQGKKVDLYTDIKKDVNALSIFKNVDSKLYVLASIFAREKGLDDVLIQNYKGGIIESTSANIFIASNGVLYTSSLEDGPIAGIMRMLVINLALEHNIKIYECTLTPQNLLAADELFFTNAISGIQWVGSYRTKRYFNSTAQRVLSLLNASVNAG